MRSVSEIDLIGAWSLVYWRIEYSIERITFPFGEDAEGLLVYSDEGWMSACISSSNRDESDRTNMRLVSMKQQAQAFSSYFSYAGRFDVADETVTHHVQIALNQSMVGTSQQRRIHLRGDKLLLSASEETGPGECRHHALLWRRASR